MKKILKWLPIVLALLAEMLICIWLAGIIDQYLYMIFHIGESNIRSPDFSYIHAFRGVFQNRGVLVCFMALQVMFLCIYLYVKIRPKADMANVKTISITDQISLPLPVGNGQYGTAWFMDKTEKEKKLYTFQFDGKTSTVPDKAGLVLEMVKVKDKEYIRTSKESLHTLIIGSTGSGKTRRVLLETICMQILKSISFIVSDVKGELFYYTSNFAERKGYKSLAFDLRNPKKSVHYNFLQPILNALDNKDSAKAIDETWSLVSVLLGEQKGEAIWYNGESATIAAGILAVCLEAPKECRNMTNVYYFIAYMCRPDAEGNMPINTYLDNLDDSHPAKIVFAMAQIAADKTRSSFFSSALGTLRLFTNPSIAEMCSKSDFDLQDISAQKTALYIIVPDEDKTLYPLVSIFIQQLYMAQVEQANGNGGVLPTKTDYDLDEIGNFPTILVLENIAAAGRSRGVRLNMIIQAYQQLEAKYKNSYNTIKNNCKLTLYLKSTEGKTLKEISDSLGNYTVKSTSASTSSSGSIKNSDGNISSSSNMTGRKLLFPEEVQRIDYPYGICMIAGSNPLMVQLPDLSKYYFNRILGLGDEDYNNKVIVQREAKRKERKIEPIPLWGIWNDEELKKVSFME